MYNIKRYADVDEKKIPTLIFFFIDTLFTVGPLPNNTEFHGRVCSVNLAGSSDWVPILDKLKTNASAGMSSATFINLVMLLITISFWL